jgi:hypothetical protein
LINFLDKRKTTQIEKRVQNEIEASEKLSKKVTKLEESPSSVKIMESVSMVEINNPKSSKEEINRNTF